MGRDVGTENEVRCSFNVAFREQLSTGVREDGILKSKLLCQLFANLYRTTLTHPLNWQPK